MSTDKYAIYLRKSREDISKEAQGAEETLSRHRNILLDVAARQGLYIEHIYEEIVSGETIAARQQMQELIKDCYAGKWRGVLCVEITRLSRGNQGDAQLILDALRYGNNNQGVLVITPTKTYDIAHNSDDEEYLEFELFMSRREYKLIKRRMDLGRERAVIEGQYMGSYRVYGYNIVKTKAIRTLEPHPDEAPIVKLIFEWAVKENLTAGQIARRLTTMGVPTYKGGAEWSNSSVKQVLMNPTYAGFTQWNSRMRIKTMVNGQLVARRPRSNHTSKYMLYEGKHPALVDVETFEAAKNRYYSDKSRSDRELRNPLAGLLVCGKCGYAMCYQMSRSDGRTAPRFNHRHSQLCKVKSVMMHDVMNALAEALKQTIADFEMQIDNLPVVDVNSIAAQRDALLNEKRKIEKRMEKLFESWEDSLITNNEFAQRKAANAEKIEDIDRQLDILEASMPSQEEYAERLLSLQDALDALLDPDISAADKNMFLKAVIKRIAFSRENLEEFILDIDLY